MQLECPIPTAHNIEPYDIPHSDYDGNPFPNPREIWRDLGDRQGGAVEYFALDPDGYLIMFSQDSGYRPLESQAPVTGLP
jgi:hypothetical protein